MFEKNTKINQEFYVDECINNAISLGLKCYFFEVDSYLCWGTPDELKTFDYWQECFHKWNLHPYTVIMIYMSVTHKSSKRE